MAVVVADDLFGERFPESEFIGHPRDKSKDLIARKPDVPNDERSNDDLSGMTENIMKSKSDENGQAMHVGTPTKLKLDPKDPLRPRRKKARRACYACQRAHLTCGDERPCQRCIKRGLADVCQDGVRKKAKYLHDAPPDALRPVLGPNFKPNYNQAKNFRQSNGYSMTRGGSENPSDRISGLFSSEVTPLYPIFNQSDSMPPSLQARLPMDGQSSTISSSPSSFNRQVPSTTHNISIPTPIPNENQVSFESASVFDQSNPAFFNFDLEGLNFGNYYGALEFGMLGHISSGAAEMSLKDHTGSAPLQGLGDVNLNGNIYGNGMSNYNQMYQSDTINFGNQPESQIFPAHRSLPNAFTIATGPQSRYSPSAEASPSVTGAYENSPTTATFTPNSTPHMPTPKSLKPAKLRGTGTSSESGTGSNIGKRSRDSSFIFDKIQEPYCYTTGFHNLTAFLQRRFSQSAMNRISKSLASIRPSFISCTMTLNRQDLVFMEKCFQRTLFEYEDFIYNCSTPTIVCRRTGEIVAVNQEFTLMTGWRKNVLLGKEPNLNINTGKPTAIENDFNSGRATFPASQVISGSGSLEQLGREVGPQPVLLAELLDDNSVVDFFQDFSRLAFNESRGSVTARCKLLKYWPGEKGDGNQSPKVSTTMKTSDSRGQDERSDVDVFANEKRRCDSTLSGSSSLGNKRLREANEKHETGNFERDRTLDCTYCWTLKRDVFDIPMMIVMNFLPCI